MHRLRLPPELWACVVDQLQGDLWATRTCSLTCSTWVPFSRRHLFRAVGFGSQRHCLYFQDVLDSSELSKSKIAHYVKIIKIAGPGLPLCRLGDQYDDGNALLLHRIFTRLPNVVDLRLHNVNFDIDLPDCNYADLRPFSHLFPFPRLEVLQLFSVVFDCMGDLPRLLSAFPQLATIDMSCIFWLRGPGLDESSVPSLSGEIATVYQPSNKLQSLRISGEAFNANLPALRQRIQEQPPGQLNLPRYVVDHRTLMLKLLCDCAPVVEGLWLLVPSVHYSALVDIDSRQFTRLRMLNMYCLLKLRVSPPPRDCFPTLPAFLSRLATRSLCILRLSFSGVPRHSGVHWDFVDWAAIDDALVQLYEHNSKLTTLIQIGFNPQPVEDFQALATTELAFPLASRLPGALRANMRIGVEHHKVPNWILLWLSSDGTSSQQGSVTNGWVMVPVSS